MLDGSSEEIPTWRLGFSPLGTFARQKRISTIVIGEPAAALAALVANEAPLQQGNLSCLTHLTIVVRLWGIDCLLVVDRGVVVGVVVGTVNDGCVSDGPVNVASSLTHFRMSGKKGYVRGCGV